ncbi:MAG: hypothetical protein ACXVDT_11360 [Bacteroidia bacterium]
MIKLDKQNGEGWRDNYKNEFKACKKEYDLFVWFEKDYYKR